VSKIERVILWLIAGAAALSLAVSSGVLPPVYKVVQGGTGRGSDTAYAPICGGTTSTAPQQSTASGSTHQTLHSGNGTGLPTFALVDETTDITGVAPLANGGTGAALSNPGANIVWVWDNTDSAWKAATIGSNLTYTHSSHTLSASGGGGGVAGPGSSTDGALAVWDGTGGNTLKNSLWLINVSNVLERFGTGTATEIGDGNLILEPAHSTDEALAADVYGDAVERFAIRADGTLDWGTGSGSTDTHLTRTAAGQLGIGGDPISTRTSTDTWTNKTFDTAGSGNSFKINGVAVTDNTGTGKVVRDTAPTLTGPVLAAGSTSVAPLTFTSGSDLTSPATGATNFSGSQLKAVLDPSSGYGVIPVEQEFHLTSTGSSITTIGNFFGSNSNISLVSGASYVIDIYLYWSNITAGTVTWTLTNSASPTQQNILYECSPLTGEVAPGSAAATMLFGQINVDSTATKTITTGTVSNLAIMYTHFRIFLQNGTGTSLKIQATKNVGGSIVPGNGSWWFCRRIAAGNVGTFAP